MGLKWLKVWHVHASHLVQHVCSSTVELSEPQAWTGDSSLRIIQRMPLPWSVARDDGFGIRNFLAQFDVRLPTKLAANPSAWRHRSRRSRWLRNRFGCICCWHVVDVAVRSFHISIRIIRERRRQRTFRMWWSELSRRSSILTWVTELTEIDTWCAGCLSCLLVSNIRQ